MSRTFSRVLLLAGLLLRLIAAQGTAPEVLGDPFSSSDSTINVCTSDCAPVVYCADREPSEYGGYELALFELVRQQLGWAPARLNWTCLEWYEMLDHMEAGDGVCDIAVAGVDITRINLEKGLTFTYPTMGGGYKILINSQDTGGVDYWLFLDSFEWQLWLAIVLTAVAVGCILWGVERWANVRPPQPGAPPYPELQPLIFSSLGRPMQLGDLESRNFAGRFIIAIFAFMMLVIASIYTANTAANLTANQLRSSIRSVEDLPGKLVGTWDAPEYIGDLSKRGIKAEGYPWDTTADLEAMFDVLRDGAVQAIVLDSYILDYHAASQCDLEVVGGSWKDYDQAVAFPSNFNNQTLLKEYSRILVSLKDAGWLENLYEEYVSPPEATCKSRGVSETTSRVAFQDVSGLWIMLAGSVGVAVLLVIGSQLALLSAKRVARTVTFQASMRRLRTMSAPQGGANAGASGGRGWRWERRKGGKVAGGSNGAPSADAELAGVASWTSGGGSHKEGEAERDSSGSDSSAPATAEAFMAEVLAAVQRAQRHTPPGAPPGLPPAPMV